MYFDEDAGEAGTYAGDEGFEDGDIVSELRTENSQLRENFQNLKDFHLKSQDSSKQLQQKYNSLFQERVEVERQYQQLCESWQQELEEKQRQFDEARAQIMQPRDLEMLRLKVLEEVEAPFKQKCHSLAKEAEAAQQSYVQLRREHEKLRNEMTALETRHREKEDEAALQHETELQRLRDEIVQLRSASVPRAESDRKVAALRQELANHEALAGRLREEAAELRQEMEAAVAAKDTAFAECEKKMFHLRESDLTMSGQVESLLRKNRSLAKQLEAAEAAGERGHGELARAKAEAKALEGQLQETKRQMESERIRAEERMNEISRLAEAKKGQLSTEVMEKSSRVAELELQLREKVHKADLEGADKLRAAQEKAAADLRALEAENRALTGKLSGLEAELKRSSKAAEDNLAKAAADVQEAKEAMDRAQKLADVLQVDKERLRAELAETKATLERSGRWPEERKSLQEQVADLRATAESLRADKEALQESVSKSQADLKEYQSLWENEAATNIRALEDAKRAWALEKSLLSRKASEQSKRGTDKLRSELARHHKKVEQYKSAVGVLKEEKAGLVLKVSELETRLSSGAGPPEPRRGAHQGGSSQRPRAVLEILSDMQAIKQKQSVYLAQR